MKKEGKGKFGKFWASQVKLGQVWASLGTLGQGNKLEKCEKRSRKIKKGK